MASQVEFQIVIIATDEGAGVHRLSPIDEGLPHSLLPIANRPLISYQFELFEKTKFNHHNKLPIKVPIIVIVNERSIEKIKQTLNEIYQDRITIDFVVIKDRMTTCEMLLKIKDKIISNNIVFMNNNLIIDDSFLINMTDTHRFNDSALTVLLKPKAPNVKGSNTDPHLEHLFTDYIALDEKKQRLVYMESATDIEEDVVITKNLLKSFPNITIYNNYQDVQFYIISKWVLELIAEDHKNKHTSILVDVKKNLIPYLLKCQLPNGASSKLPLPANSVDLSQELAYTMSSTASPFDPQSPLNIQKKKLIKCYAHLFNPEKGYCMAINTITQYHQANRDVAHGEIMYHPTEPKDETKNHYIHEGAKVTPTSVGAECIIGNGTTVGDKCNVKASIIGKHCKIGTGVRIDNCIIMDHVTIEDSCKISGSIIGNDVDIKKACEIKDSKIASNSSITDKQLIKKSISKKIINQ